MLLNKPLKDLSININNENYLSFKNICNHTNNYKQYQDVNRIQLIFYEYMESMKKIYNVDIQEKYKNLSNNNSLYFMLDLYTKLFSYPIQLNNDKYNNTINVSFKYNNKDELLYNFDSEKFDIDLSYNKNDCVYILYTSDNNTLLN
jgi:hypothetical protein